MDKPLYPHALGPCPYCGSKDLRQEQHDAVFKVAKRCGDCGRRHILELAPKTITLEDDNGKHTSFYAGQEIADVADPDNKMLVAAVACNDGVYLLAKGYGDRTSSLGHGVVGILEVLSGTLRLAAWPDFDDEDAQIVSLEDAKHNEEDDLDKEEYPYAMRLMTPKGEVVEELVYNGPIQEVMAAAEEKIVPVNHQWVIVDRRTNDLVQAANS